MVASDPVTANGTWKSMRYKDAYAIGTVVPLRSTEDPPRLVGKSPEGALTAWSGPRANPYTDTSSPGAIFPESRTFAEFVTVVDRITGALKFAPVIVIENAVIHPVL